MSNQDVIAFPTPEPSDAATVAVTSEWALPPIEPGIDARWLDAFICTRLLNVLARRYYGQVFSRLPVRDRAVLRGHVERWIEEMTEEFEQ